MARVALWAMALVFCPQPAHAAGLFLAPPGVGPLGQAGAVVASTADPLSLVYNPAGLAFAQRQLLLDGALPWFVSSYTRRVTANGPALPTVHGRPLGFVSPNLGLVWRFGGVGGPRVGALITSDYPLIQRWPDARSNPETPQRYATGGFGGTALVRALVGAGFTPWPKVGLGASLQLLLGVMRTVTTLSACDGVVCRQPENPAYDASVAMRSALIAVPGFGAGAVGKLTPWLSLGLSYSSAFVISTKAALDVRLPSAPLYRGADVTPARPSARLRLQLPAVWRLGAVFSLPHGVQLEAALSYVPWRVHRTLTLDNIDAAFVGMVAIDSFRIAQVTIPRRLQDTLAGHLAARRTFIRGAHTWLVRGGVMVEPSAAPPSMLTAMAVDLPKGLLSLSAGWRYRATQWTLSYGAMVMLKRQVVDSAVKQINPTQQVNSRDVTAVGNGRYQGSAHLAGLSAQLFF